jgi:hypothetical protein
MPFQPVPQRVAAEYHRQVSLHPWLSRALEPREVAVVFPSQVSPWPQQVLPRVAPREVVAESL